MGGDCAAQDGPPPVTIQLRYRRLAIIICTFVAAMLALVIPISMDLVVIHAFDSSTMHAADQYDVRDDYNSLVSSVVSALSIPKDWLIGSVLPVCFLTFASSRHMQKDQTFWTGAAFMGIDLSIRYLINIGFQATHVQLTQKIQMRINDHDLTANMDALDIMQSYSTNVSNIVPESLADSDNYINYMTNTVLRNVLAPIALKTTSPKCSPSNKSEDSYDSSQFGTGLVQSYGFPIRDWQSTMLPTNEFIGGSSFQVPMSGNITDIEGAQYLLSVDTTVNLFIHAMHVSQYFFRWLDPNSTPFNISALIKQSKQPDSVTSGNELNAPNYSVHASELLHLLPSNSSDDDEYNLKFFFEAARDLFNKSLSSGVNLSQADSTMTFAHGGIDRGDITYDAVTLEVPLRRNFYYRKLIMDDHGDALTEDKNATALYTDISNAANTSDIYYDLDMSVDCGPNPGACVLPRVQTYDFLGRKYQPDPQIKATAVCVNDDGSEDFKIEYNYYTVDGNASNTHLDAAWTCKRKSNTSMYIVSFGSRIEGDEMYDGRAPDSAETRPRLDAKRVTIKNPRKIYSMTVVRLEWKFVHLADNLTISCGTKDNNCDGLVYLSDRPVGGKFENNSIDDESIQPFILVGKNSVPIESLSPFLYDDTERTGTYTGFGTATRWVSLMTLATPTEDAIYSQKGDLLLSYNFRKFNRSSEKRKDRDCSASAEDYLNHVVNNHYYMDHGLCTTSLSSQMKSVVWHSKEIHSKVV